MTTESLKIRSSRDYPQLQHNFMITDSSLRVPEVSDLEIKRVLLHNFCVTAYRTQTSAVILIHNRLT